MKLWRAISMGMMLGGVLFLAACPGDLEDAQDDATKGDAVENKGTLEDCVNGCQETATKAEADCQAKLTEAETVDKTSLNSPWLACKNSAMGDMSGCQVECNAKFRGGRTQY
jgi:hypothetical protein